MEGSEGDPGSDPANDLSTSNGKKRRATPQVDDDTPRKQRRQLDIGDSSVDFRVPNTVPEWHKALRMSVLDTLVKEMLTALYSFSAAEFHSLSLSGSSSCRSWSWVASMLDLALANVQPDGNAENSANKSDARMDAFPRTLGLRVAFLVHFNIIVRDSRHADLSRSILSHMIGPMGTSLADHKVSLQDHQEIIQDFAQLLLLDNPNINYFALPDIGHAEAEREAGGTANSLDQHRPAAAVMNDMPSVENPSQYQESHDPGGHGQQFQQATNYHEKPIEPLDFQGADYQLGSSEAIHLSPEGSEYDGQEDQDAVTMEFALLAHEALEKRWESRTSTSQLPIDATPRTISASSQQPPLPQPHGQVVAHAAPPSFRAPPMTSNTPLPLRSAKVQTTRGFIKPSQLPAPIPISTPGEPKPSLQEAYQRARTAEKVKNASRQAPRPPNNLRKPWTTSEEQALLQGLEKVKGPHWAEILQMYGENGTVNDILKGRSQVQLKDKARNMKVFFLKSGFPMPEFFQDVTGNLQTRAPGRRRNSSQFQGAESFGDESAAEDGLALLGQTTRNADLMALIGGNIA